MNIIFLDIDGVLNSEKLAGQMDRQHIALGCANRYALRESGHCTCYKMDNQIDPATVERLNQIIERTSTPDNPTYVVISSSWRKLLDTESIGTILRGHGFRGDIIGQTPDLPNDPVWLERKRQSSNGHAYYDHIERGHEIWEWFGQRETMWKTFRDILGNSRVESFVILDDCGDMARLKSCLVQTDDRVGLDDQDVEVAIQLMGRSVRALQAIREEES